MSKGTKWLISIRNDAEQLSWNTWICTVYFPEVQVKWLYISMFHKQRHWTLSFTCNPENVPDICQKYLLNVQCSAWILAHGHRCLCSLIAYWYHLFSLTADGRNISLPFDWSDEDSGSSSEVDNHSRADSPLPDEDAQSSPPSENTPESSRKG